MSEKRKKLLIISVIIIIIVVASITTWYWYTYLIPREVTLAYLCITGPEPELIVTTFDWYLKEHPDTRIKFAPEVYPRDVGEMKIRAEAAEKKNNYQLLWGFVSHMQWMIGMDLLTPMEELLPEDLLTKVKNNVPSFVLEYLQKDGKTYAIPIYWNSIALFYRKDLFEDPVERTNFKARYGYDLKPPETFKELLDIAEFFTRPPDLYGWSANGKGWAFYWDEVWTFIPCATGVGMYIDYDAETTLINSEEAIKAFEVLAELTKYSPPGWETADWFTTGDVLFAEGKLAMWLNWYYPWPTFQNPEKSKVVGKVNVAPPPTLDKTIKPLVPLSGGGVGVNKYATPEQKRAAIEFLKWMLSDEVQRRMYLTGELFIPARTDILADPEVSTKLKAEPFLEILPKQSFWVQRYEVGLLEPLWASESVEALLKIVRGEMTAKEATDWLAAHIVKVIKESKAK